MDKTSRINKFPRTGKENQISYARKASRLGSLAARVAYMQSQANADARARKRAWLICGALG